MGEYIILGGWVDAFWRVQRFDFSEGPVSHNGHIHLLIKMIISGVLCGACLMEPAQSVVFIGQIAVQGGTAEKVHTHVQTSRSLVCPI